MLHAVIMAGGSGTRFWPVSRKHQPKQLLQLTGNRTMLQATVDRLESLVPHDRILIATSRHLASAVRQQLPEIPATAILGEPCGRDTAPCVGLAAATLALRDPDATLVVMPADHLIQPASTFCDSLQVANQLVAHRPSRLVTFGIRPSYAAECFGYIERGPRMEEPAVTAGRAFEVLKFHEKPPANLARQYVESGNFYWNSGIFVWQAATILDAIHQFEPALRRRLRTIAEAWGQPQAERVLETEFAAMEKRSIDHAVLEKARDVVVIEAPFGWDDVGSWQALTRLHPADDHGNTRVGKTLCWDTSGCIVHSEGSHLIATLGLRDCLIVHTRDATLVAPKSQEEAVRQVVQQLEERGWSEYL